MNALFNIMLAGFAVAGWAMFRYAPKVKAAVVKVGLAGDDVYGWARIGDYMSGRGEGSTVRAAKKGATRSAKVMLWAFAVIFSLFSFWLRAALLVFLIAKAVRAYRRAKAKREALARSGFRSREERDLIAAAFRNVLKVQGLGTKYGDEMILPDVWGWKREPILVGGRKLKGAYCYTCNLRPVSGKGAQAIMKLQGRGLDGTEDPLRDSMNGALAGFTGKGVTTALRAWGGKRPQLAMSTVEYRLNRGTPNGELRVKFWSVDPFRYPINYPYDVTKPVVEDFHDAAPVGLYRNGSEARVFLAQHSMISGQTRSGKSSIARPALVAAAHTDCHIICIALKGPSDYIDLSPRFMGGKVITKREEAINALRWAYHEIKRRNELTPQQRKGLRPILILGDELQELGDDIAAVTPIVKLAGSTDIWMWTLTQYTLAAIVPSEQRSEYLQKMAGRIDGNVNAANVVMQGRATKTAGPHLIPPTVPGGTNWRGVLFDNEANYLRAFWVTCDSFDGAPSDMKRCADSLPERPGDPDGFLDVVEGRVKLDAAPELEVRWDESIDGASRPTGKEATHVDFRGNVPVQVMDAVTLLNGLIPDRRMPAGRVQVSKIQRLLDAVTDHLQREDAVDGDELSGIMDAMELVSMYIRSPL